MVLVKMKTNLYAGVVRALFTRKTLYVAPAVWK